MTELSLLMSFLCTDTKELQAKVSRNVSSLPLTSYRWLERDALSPNSCRGK